MYGTTQKLQYLLQPSMIDTNADHCAAADAAGLTAINGSGLDEEVLAEAHAAEAKALLPADDTLALDWTSVAFDDGAWIGVNPGAFYGSAKRWPPERFAAVADMVARRTGAKVVLVGGPRERPLAESMARAKLPSALAATMASVHPSKLARSVSGTPR